MTKRRKRQNAGEGYGYMFHGAFKEKKNAVAKERKTKGAWVKGVHTKQGHRYLVMSPRTNPRKANPGRTRVFADRSNGRFTATRLDKDLGNMTGAGFTKKEALNALKENIRRAKEQRSLGAYARRPALAGVNPSELIVMAANPNPSGRDREITVPPGTTITIRTNPSVVSANPPDRYTAAHAIARGITRRAPGLIQTKRQKRVAGIARRARQHKYDWIPPQGLAPGMNPSAAALREKFTGKESEWIQVLDEPHVPTGDYAQLGELLALYVKPNGGGQVQTISFRSDRPLLVSDESARQIYFVAGNQDLGAGLAVFGPREVAPGRFELGEVQRIDYKQRKEHVPDPDLDEWRHSFGEESGVRPLLIFDRNSKRLWLEGGEYQIRAEGIVN
jgi:hypothetical protein